MQSTPTDSIGRVIQRLESKLLPLVTSVDSAVAAIRQDSGTVRADSSFLHFRAALMQYTRAVVRTFDDSAFQVLIWPQGALGYQKARRQRQLGLPVDAPDTVMADSITRFLVSRAVWVNMAEGTAYFVLNDSSLVTTFGRFLTPPTQEFLRIAALEQTRPSAADASLMITWDGLGERLSRTDRFLTMHPNAGVRDSVRVRHLWYLRFYLRGADNSEVFQRRTRTLEAEPRASYERYVSRYGSTPTGELIRGYLEALRANGYRDGDTAIEFLRKNSGLTGSHDLPPRRQTSSGPPA